jgi:hypothetical protein
MADTNNIPGNFIVGGSVTADTLTGGTINGMTRAQLPQEAFQIYKQRLTDMRVHDAIATVLPAAAGADDMGLVTGTPGTDAPTLQGVDFGGTTSDEKATFVWPVPVEYDDGQSISVSVRAGILTTVADASLTIDVECWKADGDGLVGSDICATAAQSCNSLTIAAKTFVVTPTGVVSGDLLVFRLTFAGTDSGDAGVMIPVVTSVAVLADIKG